jgi:hypothetical protein
MVYKVKMEDVVLTGLLLIIGIGLTIFSLQGSENFKIEARYLKAHSWSVFGWVEKGQVIAVDLKPSRSWTQITPGEEVFDVGLNFTISCEGVGSVNITCYYEVYLSSDLTTFIFSPKNVSLCSSSSSGFLDVSKSGPVNGFLAIGFVNVSGNYTLTLSSESVEAWFPSLSGTPDAPNSLTLAVYNVNVDYSYLFLLPVGLGLLGLGVYMLVSGVRRAEGHRRVKRHR